MGKVDFIKLGLKEKEKKFGIDIFKMLVFYIIVAYILAALTLLFMEWFVNHFFGYTL